MADHFLGALKELERRTHDNVLIFSTVLSERLDDLTASMINNPLSDNDYMKLMELYYQKFQKMEKRNAMMYCLLRIQQIASFKENVKLQKRVKLIEFSEDYDEFTSEFLFKKRPYYKNMQIDFKKRALLISFLCAVFFLIVGVLVVQVKFLIGWILSLIIYVGSYFWFSKRGFFYFFDSRLQDLKAEVDPLLIDLNEAIFFENSSKK